jgi:hypothetical protein
MLADDRGHPSSIKIMKTLDNVLLAAQQAGVGFSCVYCVGDNSWYFTVDSAAPSENWVGKNHSFGIAVECVLEHLAKLNHDNTLA